jgi:hypothetical protein
MHPTFGIEIIKYYILKLYCTSEPALCWIVYFSHFAIFDTIVSLLRIQNDNS